MKAFCKLSSNIGFKGKAALQAIEKEDIKRRLLGFSIEDSTIDLNGGEVIYKDGSKVVGYIKRAGFGYTVNRHIGYGYIEIEKADRKSTSKDTIQELLKSSYEIDIMGKRVVAEPLVKAAYDSARKKILI